MNKNEIDKAVQSLREIIHGAKNNKVDIAVIGLLVAELQAYATLRLSVVQNG